MLFYPSQNLTHRTTWYSGTPGTFMQNILQIATYRFLIVIDLQCFMNYRNHFQTDLAPLKR
jgi:hypothetical protein